ncbi:hypothetical protein LguiB_007272 [Lonicera macranthoides]
MGIRMPHIIHTKKLLRMSSFTAASTAIDVPKGHFAVYVGEHEKKRFVIPVSFLNEPSFQDLLSQAEEERRYLNRIMGIRMPRIIQAKQILRRTSFTAASTAVDVPKGYFAVYVGEQEKKRFVVPISFLKMPSFQDLLSQSEEEFGFDHPMGGLTIPCRQDIFTDITCRMR